MPNLKRRGFSLVELSIVMVVIGVMLAMSLNLGSGQINNENVKLTQSKLDKIDKALVTYFQVNNRMPCPAGTNVAKDSIGTERTYGDLSTTNYNTATCAVTVSEFTAAGQGSGGSVYIGIVPVRTLGLPDDYAFDGWGNRITYAVSKYCVDPNNWSGANTFKCSAASGAAASTGTDGSNITIMDTSGAVGGVAKPTRALYALLSMGRDGFGAFNTVGTRLAAAPAAHVKEVNNSGVYTNAIFNEGQINDNKITANYFDDLVHWKTAARFWDDVYGSSSTQPCAATTEVMLMSSGMGYYGCYASFGTPSVGSVIWAGSTDAAASEIAVTIPADKKYFSISAKCTAAGQDSQNYGRTGVKVVFKQAGAEIASYYVCYSYDEILTNYGQLRAYVGSGGSLFIPIPDGALSEGKIYVYPVWYDNYGSGVAAPQVTATWYFH